jgi:hypothetical protein
MLGAAHTIRIDREKRFIKLILILATKIAAICLQEAQLIARDKAQDEVLWLKQSPGRQGKRLLLHAGNEPKLARFYIEINRPKQRH